MRKKVAILVPNPCDPDFRVIKQAEFFAAHGAEVRVFCRARAGSPRVETVNNVTYVRRPMVGARLLLVLPQVIATSLRSIAAIMATLKTGEERRATSQLAEARKLNRAIIQRLVADDNQRGDP